ncbi:hypothetical protein GGTG_04830 [Gaeumannomyces tritici R3-111a-1]|uniref:Uncharacterized protein n=1 Tax=Gaeumannomyces tritici (strain R3-111a-1) TaxID=644352 RepID=J3NU75_GAET3|nr:hypothetical protein GGTG_04830 [Gaeumannomyces tritici R3-111a-1]EJT79746.1 hypothetical protein GGTG_04830 [Gaeumannomyces tritici R3-111a-1]
MAPALGIVQSVGKSDSNNSSLVDRILTSSQYSELRPSPAQTGGFPADNKEGLGEAEPDSITCCDLTRQRGTREVGLEPLGFQGLIGRHTGH